MLTLRSIDVDKDSQKTGLWILSYQGSAGLSKKPPIEVDAWFFKFHGSDQKDEDSHRGNFRIGKRETKKFALS